MEFHQLTYFLAAAQTQNFRKAADLCIVAQSALSRQIAALEKELEVELFTRQKKRVILTPEGQEFALYVRNAMEQLQEGQQFIAELGIGQRGTIRIIKELFRQPLHLLVSAQHPLAKRTDQAGITMEQLTAEPLLLLDETSRMGQITRRIFTQRGVPLHPLVEIELVEGLKEMVRQGVGVTLTLPALIRLSQIGNDLVLIPIADLEEEFIFALVYRRVGSISRAAREFINTITKQIVPFKVQ